MSILIIGQSAFLAQNLRNLQTSRDWHFISHKDAIGTENWPEDTKTVINFAFDPIIRQGEFSNVDHQFAQKAQDIGAHYIMLSSRAAYGLSNIPVTIIEDKKTFSVITPYGHAKKQIEDDLLSHFDHITILRLSNIFGFEYRPEKPRATFMGMMLKSLKEKNTINFSMNPMTQRDFLPLGAFSRQLAIIAQEPKSGIYNLGSGFGTATGDIAQWIMNGYGAGKLIAEKSNILDSFVLDMGKTRSAYHLETINTHAIENACIKIGQQLKEI